MTTRRLAELMPRHTHAVQALQSALVSGRMHHAYMLVSRDLGAAIELAHAVAMALVCDARLQAVEGSGSTSESVDPAAADGCGVCTACRKAQSGNHPDIIYVADSGRMGSASGEAASESGSARGGEAAAEGATEAPSESAETPAKLTQTRTPIAIAAIRELGARLMLKAREAPYKVVIVDEAARMNTAAQNALLKTLEEPPGAVVFLLTTARPKALLPTVRSRCQVMPLPPLTPEVARATLMQCEDIPSALVPALAALVGDDCARARRCIELGAEDILTQLDEALSPATPAARKSRLAAELGSDRETADLALALLEVSIRDRLAEGAGAQASDLYTAPAAATSRPELSRATLAALAARLSVLRQYVAMHFNRTMALEELFLNVR